MCSLQARLPARSKVEGSADSRTRHGSGRPPAGRGGHFMLHEFALLLVRRAGRCLVLLLASVGHHAPRAAAAAPPPLRGLAPNAPRVRCSGRTVYTATLCWCFVCCRYETSLVGSWLHIARLDTGDWTLEGCRARGESPSRQSGLGSREYECASAKCLHRGCSANFVRARVA